MILRKNLIPFLLLALCLTFNSCGKVEKTAKPLAEAHASFLKKIREEYELPNTQLTVLNKTIWVFIPFKGPLFEYKASRKSEAPMEKKEGWSVNFLETTAQDKTFNINYDISKLNKYLKDPGYGSNYSETFNLIYQKATTALRQSYMDTPTPPEFMVLIFADITNGIKLTYTMYTEDFKYYSIGQLPHEEFIKRLQTELEGDTYLIEDTEGKSIQPTEIVMTNFLAKQITNRINFKYGQSDFPPSEDMKKEILYQVNQTFDAYKFNNFNSITLQNRVDGSSLTISPGDLANYKDMPLPEGGKIHVIKFN